MLIVSEEIGLMRAKLIIERRFKPLLLALAAPGRPFAAFHAQDSSPCESSSTTTFSIRQSQKRRHCRDRFGRRRDVGGRLRILITGLNNFRHTKANRREA